MEELPSGRQLADRHIERRRSSDDSVESLSHLESATLDAVSLDRSSATEPGFSGPIDAQLNFENLRQELDLARLRLYSAVDQVRGAEAGRAAALGRIADVEFQLHLCEVEIASLKAELETVRTEASSLRLLAARRVRDTIRRSLGGGD